MSYLIVCDQSPPTFLTPSPAALPTLTHYATANTKSFSPSAHKALSRPGVLTTCFTPPRMLFPRLLALSSQPLLNF